MGGFRNLSSLLSESEATGNVETFQGLRVDENRKVKAILRKYIFVKQLLYTHCTCASTAVHACGVYMVSVFSAMIAHS